MATNIPVRFLLQQENPIWKMDISIHHHEESVLLTDGSKYGMIQIYVSKIPEFIEYLQTIYQECNNAERVDKISSGYMA